MNRPDVNCSPSGTDKFAPRHERRNEKSPQTPKSPHQIQTSIRRIFARYTYLTFFSLAPGPKVRKSHGPGQRPGFSKIAACGPKVRDPGHIRNRMDQEAIVNLSKCETHNRKRTDLDSPMNANITGFLSALTAVLLRNLCGVRCLRLLRWQKGWRSIQCNDFFGSNSRSEL